jgi:diguanylate cyclase (GGDEF)-like protein/PAS domain S-box-containing protein
VVAAASFQPFARRRRLSVAVLVVVFALFSVFSLGVSRRSAQRSAHRASLVRTIARQRTLAARYADEVILTTVGKPADPAATGEVLEQSARALLDGGVAPAVEGDDDEVTVPPPTTDKVRRQLEQDRRLVKDLLATGRLVLAGKTDVAIRPTANERITSTDPIQRLRVLAGLTSNVALNASRTAANETDRNVKDLENLQAVLALLSAVVAGLVGWALIATTRRQSAHFRSLVTHSTDLVFVHARGRVVYVSDSVGRMLGMDTEEIERSLFDHVHPDDHELLEDVCTNAVPPEIVVRVRSCDGEWRYLDARVTDLRNDRHVRGVVLNARDVTERVRLEGELTHQAFHDGLTLLANRALFRDRLEQALARSSRNRDCFSVLLFDLDGFKQVNDSLGHTAGDSLLRHAAERLHAITRPVDTLARLGGDEFAMLLDGTDDSGAVVVAERVLEALGEPVYLAERALALSASVGIVVHHGGPGDAEELMRHADVAMYAAKGAGRARYELFRHEMARDLAELVSLEHDLRMGLQRKEFVVHYQPTVDIRTGVVTGAEALVRWDSPIRGLVPPIRFIPIAETTGLIHQLGEYVLREATRQVAEWVRAGLVSDDFAVWVNVSGRQLEAGGLDAIVSAAIADAGTTPNRLGLEITENAIVDDGPTGNRARVELERVHDLGVHIALDDFGTGFSSLAYLHRLPIDVIKVDRSFVADVERDAKNAAITANLTSLAHALGLLSVAEGIETEVQLAAVKQLGCDIAQGYLLARPAPAAAVTEYLAEQRQTRLRPSA